MLILDQFAHRKSVRVVGYYGIRLSSLLLLTLKDGAPQLRIRLRHQKPTSLCFQEFLLATFTLFLEAR